MLLLQSIEEGAVRLVVFDCLRVPRSHAVEQPRLLSSDHITEPSGMLARMRLAWLAVCGLNEVVGKLLAHTLHHSLRHT
jgi:hypothetical protein